MVSGISVYRLGIIMSNKEKKIEQIYMPLLNEGVPVIAPIKAEFLEDKTYRILRLENEDTENWLFSPGTIVKCKLESWSVGKVLVVREEVEIF
jgi:hypothetical protein